MTELEAAQQEVGNLQDMIVVLQEALDEARQQPVKTVGSEAWKRFRRWLRGAIAVTGLWGATLVGVLATGLPGHVIQAAWAGLVLVGFSWAIPAATVVYHGDDKSFSPNHVCERTSCPWAGLMSHQKLEHDYPHYARAHPKGGY